MSDAMRPPRYWRMRLLNLKHRIRLLEKRMRARAGRCARVESPSGARCRNRTDDLPLTRRLLWPTELSGRNTASVTVGRRARSGCPRRRDGLGSRLLTYGRYALAVPEIIDLRGVR